MSKLNFFCTVSNNLKNKGSPMDKSRNPDKGHQMKTGDLPFDKGYETSNKNISHAYPESKERGNRYVDLQNDYMGKDSKKLARSKFSKIA